MKTCRKCNINKEDIAFSKGRMVCKDCRRLYMKSNYDNNKEYFKNKASEWIANNPEKYKQYAKTSKINNKSSNRNKYLQKRFGITLEEFDCLSIAQNHVCKICNEPEKVNKNLNVDHCHKTGKIRGLLCTSCNTALGLFKDLKSNLEKAIGYLDEQL